MNSLTTIANFLGTMALKLYNTNIYVQASLKTQSEPMAKNVFN